MATASAPVHRQNPANKDITTDTRALSQWCRYINGAVIAFLFALYAGEHHIPEHTVTPAEWHWFLRIVCSAVFFFFLDRAQALNNLFSHRRKQRDIEEGRVREVIFGKKEFQFQLSWWLFYAKLTLTFLNVLACVVVFGPIVSRWIPS
jgi:hypothetical protein